jgi:phospholipid/cholesterol/gamma-HCH transport system substrate-binding protein
MRTEVKVGLFVLIGLISLLYMTFQIKTLEDFKQKGYSIYAIVDDASGITKKSRVKLRGVKIGQVDNMILLDNGVKLKLKINKNVKIPEGSKVTIAQDNVLGGKYVKIIPGNSSSYIPPNGIIKKYIPAASMEDVLTNANKALVDVRKILKKINLTLNQETIDNFHEIVANLKLSSIKLNDILTTTQVKLPTILDNANALLLTYKKSGDILRRRLPSILRKTDLLLAKLNKTGDILNAKLPKLANEYIKLGKNVNTILKENRKGLKQTINSASDFFASGSKSFQKLDEMLGSLQKSQIEVDIYSNYMLRDDYFKTTANIAYRPNPTKYYIFGVKSTKDYSVKNPKDENKIYFNAMLGKRFDNLLIRGGIIESTGGLGADYFLDKDRVKLSADIYDFNSVNDIRGDRPNLSLKATYIYLKHLEFIAGIDNILNTDARTFFLGLGVKFIDNDLKTIIAGGGSTFLK